MKPKLIKKKILKHQGGGITSIVRSDKNPDLSKQLIELGAQLNVEQAKATERWHLAFPKVPIDSLLTEARKPGFNNTMLEGTYNTLKEKYGDNTIPMTPEHIALEDKYTQLTNKVRGMPMSSTGTKEGDTTRNVGYRLIFKRNPRAVGELPYQYLNKTK